MRNKVSLEIVAGALKGKKFEFTEHDTFIFRRAADCHARRPGDTLVSRHHFILEVNPPLARLAGELFATDLARDGRPGRVVPDFLIGAHAKIHADRLLVRGFGFLRDYFKVLKVLEL